MSQAIPNDVLSNMVAEAGADPNALSGRLFVELIATAGKLLADGADDGELKLIVRAVKELRYAMKVFRPYRGIRKCSVFGSARTMPDHAHYAAAEQFSEQISEAGWMVITGAGGGIMAAGNGGAGRERSFGVAIRLPFETTHNESIAGDSKLITFRYFFTRKLMFNMQADAVACFPGGFGTHDEVFEILTLVQTGKTVMKPLVMIDEQGGDYWTHWHDYTRAQLLSKQMISPADLSLYLVTDNVREAREHVLRFYRNYHSQRYVRDDLVFRLNVEPTESQIGALNDEFADLVADGRIETCGPLEGETMHLDKPRLKFIFAKHKYGKLRQMIDRINGWNV